MVRRQGGDAGSTAYRRCEKNGVRTLLYSEERQTLAYFMRRLYRQRLTTTSGGNLSCRAGTDHIAITGSASDKGELAAEQVGVLTLAGENVTPQIRPSIESAMHLEIYRRHPGVRAIVHAHPTTASLFTATETPIDTHLTAEAYVIVGDPVRAAYARMGTPQLAARVAEAVERGVCILMDNHGVLTVGASPLEAFDRMEVVEVAARQTLMALSLPGVRRLDAAGLVQLDELVGRSRDPGDPS